MKNEINNVRILGAYQLSTPRAIKIDGAAHRALVIRLNQKQLYRVGEERFSTVRGDAIFIPRGAHYETQPVGGNNEYLIVRFQSDEAGEWEITHVDDIGEARAIHRELCRALVFDDRKSRMRALSLFYRLLSVISEGPSAENYLSSRKLEILRPALDYVEKNIYSPSLMVRDLHLRSGVSEVYFRELFSAHTGMNPQSYITAKRLERAREIIEEGTAEHIRDVAESVGYTDALYFSRIYKKRFGHAPSASEGKKAGLL